MMETKAETWGRKDEGGGMKDEAAEAGRPTAAAGAEESFARVVAEWAGLSFAGAAGVTTEAAEAG
jgi:hypothetical protein